MLIMLLWRTDRWIIHIRFFWKQHSCIIHTIAFNELAGSHHHQSWHLRSLHVVPEPCDDTIAAYIISASWSILAMKDLIYNPNGHFDHYLEKKIRSHSFEIHATSGRIKYMFNISQLGEDYKVDWNASKIGMRAMAAEQYRTCNLFL